MPLLAAATALAGPASHPSPSLEEVKAAAQAAYYDTAQYTADPAVLLDPDRRAKVKDSAIRALRKAYQAMGDLLPLTAGDERASVDRYRDAMVTLLIVYGDDEALTQTKKRADATGLDAANAKIDLLSARWILAHDAAAQQAVIADETVALAMQNLDNNLLAGSIQGMIDTGGSPEAVKRLQEVYGRLTNTSDPSVKATYTPPPSTNQGPH